MASQAATARESHLQASSEALMFTSPSTSAYLQTQKTNTSDESSKANTNPQICSCGRRLLPGWNCKVRSVKKHTRKDRLAGKSASKTLSCPVCNAVHILSTRTKIRNPRAPKSPVITDFGTKAKTPFAPPQPTPTTAEPGTSATRKRSRNKKSSLQAMLADRKPGGTSNVQGFGLGLGDFMK